MVGAPIAWDCADDAYREHAYNCMAEELARLREALTVIADWDQVNYSNEYESGLRGIIRSITDRARDALNQQIGPKT